MTIRNKDGTLTSKARKKNGRLFTNWISGTGRNHADDTLELLAPNKCMKLLLARRPISKNEDVFFVTRRDVRPDGSGETIFFCLLRYTDRNITEIGFSKAGGGTEIITISKWREMDGGLRFLPGKQTIDADELLVEVGRALYRMSPNALLEAVGRADDITHWTATFSPTELVEKIRGESSEELRCARTYKLIVSIFFMNDTDRSRADYFYRLVAENMTNGDVEYADVCDKYLSHFPLELNEALCLASEMVKSEASLALAVTPAIPPQGTNAPLVATKDLLAEKFLEAEAKARTEQEHLFQLKPTMPEASKNKAPAGVVLPPAAVFLKKGGLGGTSLLVPAHIPSRMDLLRMVRRKSQHVMPRAAVVALRPVAPAAPLPTGLPASPSQKRMADGRARGNRPIPFLNNTKTDLELTRSSI